MRHIKCTSYVATVFEPEAQKVAVEELCRLMGSDEFKEVNCIVGCGVSGTLLAAIVAHKTGRMVTVVRKAEQSHSTYKVEGIPVHAKMRYVIIDDLISSGDTIKRIKDGVRSECCDAEFVGLLLYHHSVQTKDYHNIVEKDWAGEEHENERKLRLYGVRPLGETDVVTYPNVDPAYVAGFHVEWNNADKNWYISNLP